MFAKICIILALRGIKVSMTSSENIVGVRSNEYVHIEVERPNANESHETLSTNASFPINNLSGSEFDKQLSLYVVMAASRLLCESDVVKLVSDVSKILHFNT